MNSELWEKAENLFDQLVNLNQEERLKFIKDTSFNDKALAETLQKMLDAESDDSFMSSKPAVNLKENEADNKESVLGHFQLLEKVAVGGMGRIYRAKQVNSDVPVYVALKLIRKELISEQMIQRFSIEKQILGKLKHHNIAALMDAGVVDDTPFLATEWVDGHPINAYCKQHKLGLQKTLNLFLQVCDAVAYAHSQLVIHRDLKPANIFVDNNGQVKLLDFGIAKLLDTEAAHLTQTQVFTPEYAAPEQINGETCSTTTDIYALGILLFELLVGEKRFGMADLSIVDKIKAITQPTTVFASQIMGQKQIKNAAKTKGALDTIINKAMHFDHKRRYQSAYELISDIKRYKQHLPIKAMGDGWFYRFNMLVRRHTWSSLLTFLLFVSLSTGLIYTNHQKAKAIESQILAQSESEKSQQMLNFFMTTLESASPISGGSTQISVKDMFVQGSDNIDLNTIKDEGIRAVIAGQIAEIFTELFEYELAIKFNNKALAYYSQDIEKHASKFLYHHINIANAFQKQNLYAQALEKLNSAYQKVNRHQLDESVHAEAMINFGQYHIELNQVEKAHVFLEKAEDLAALVSDLESLGKVKYYQYLILQHELSAQKSEQYLKQAQYYFEQAYPKGHPDLLAVRNSLAIKYKGEGDYNKARQIFELLHTENTELYGFKDYNYLTNHADSLFYLGDFSRAFDLVSESLKLIEDQGVEDGFSSMAATVIQARCLTEMGRFEEATAGLQLAIDYFKQHYESDHLVTMVLRSYKLDLLNKSGAKSTNPNEEVEIIQLAKKQLNESNSSRRRFVNTAIIASTSYWIKGQLNQALSLLEEAEPEAELVSQKQDWGYWLILAGIQQLKNELGLEPNIQKLNTTKYQLFKRLPENHWYHVLFEN